MTILGAGCQPEPRTGEPPVGAELMQPDQAVRHVDRIVTAHAAAGARSDAMLFRHHFGERDLNALGRAKLDLMRQDVEGSEDERLIVYLSLPADDASSASRRESVSRYLAGSGLPEGRFEVQFGLNPDSNPTATLPVPGGDAAKPRQETTADRATPPQPPPPPDGSGSGTTR